MEHFELSLKMFMNKYQTEVIDYYVYEVTTVIPGYYIIFIETEKNLDSIEANELDNCLKKDDFDYEDCRKCGDIDIPVVCLLKKGTFIKFKDFKESKGESISQYKPIKIITDKKTLDFFKENVYYSSSILN